MSIATEIARLQTAKADIKSAIESKGVVVPSAATLDDYASLISSIGDRYTMLEYLQSDGTFYIPTNIYLTSSMWFDYKFQVTTAPPSGGHQQLLAGNSYRVAQIGSAGSFYLRRGDKNGGGNALLISSTPYFNVGTELYVVAFKGGNDVLVNGASRGTLAPVDVPTDTVPAWFFSINQTTDIATYGIKGKLSYMKIGSGNNLLYNFIPAKRNSDNNIGLYDTVNDVFYPSVSVA